MIKGFYNNRSHTCWLQNIKNTAGTYIFEKYDTSFKKGFMLLKYLTLRPVGSIY